MEVTTESLRRWTLELSSAGTDNKRRRHLIWVVLAAFYGVRYNNDPRNLPRDGERMEFWRLSPGEASAKLVAAVPNS